MTSAISAARKAGPSTRTKVLSRDDSMKMSEDSTKYLQVAIHAGAYNPMLRSHLGGATDEKRRANSEKRVANSFAQTNLPVSPMGRRFWRDFSLTQ